MALRSGFRAEIGHFRDVPMWVNGKNGRSGGKNQTAAGRLWAVLGGIPSGWEQFVAVKKKTQVIGGPRRQLNGL